MGNPGQPSHVKVDKLKDVLIELQQLSEDLTSPRPGSWTDVGTSIESDLAYEGGTGLQENVAEVAGKRYADNVYFIGRAQDHLKSGVTTIISLLQTTIDTHSNADSSAADNATRTNTGQPAAPAGKG